MKTSRTQMEALRARLAEMNGAGDVQMPVSLLRDMVDDALDFHKCEEALDRGFAKIMATVDEPPKPIAKLRLVKREPTGGDAA